MGRQKIIIHELDDGRWGVSIIADDHATARAVAELFARRIEQAIVSGDVASLPPSISTTRMSPNGDMN